MRSNSEAKLIVTVEGNKRTKRIDTISIYDNRTGKYWTVEQIQERGIEWFLDFNDMKETLNWNLNGDESKFKFKWGMTSGDFSEGRAFIFN